MCAFDEKTSPERSGRRRAALIACFVPLFTSTWLFLVPRHGESHSFGPFALGIGVGVALGIGALALRRLR